MPGSIFIGSYSNISSGELHIRNLITLEPISYYLLFIRGEYVKYSQEIIPKLYANIKSTVNGEDNTLIDLSSPISIKGQLFYDSLYEFPYKGIDLNISLYLKANEDLVILENTMIINGMIAFQSFNLSAIGDSQAIIVGKHIFDQKLRFTGKGHLKITGDFNGVLFI